MDSRRATTGLLIILACTSLLVNVIQFSATSARRTAPDANHDGLREAARNSWPTGSDELRQINQFMTNLTWDYLKTEIARTSTDPISAGKYSSNSKFSAGDKAWQVVIRQRNDPGVTHKVYDRVFTVEIVPKISEGSAWDHPPGVHPPESIKDSMPFLTESDFTPIGPE